MRSKRLASLLLSATCVLMLGAHAHARPMEIVATGLAYPEGPVLAPGGGIYLADMERDEIILFRSGFDLVAFSTAPCGPTALIQKFYAHDAFAIISFTCHMQAEIRSAAVWVDANGMSWRPPINSIAPINRPNDMTGREDGAFYVTSSGEFDPDLSGQGSVWFVNPHSRALGYRQVAEGFDYANGITLSPDERTLYVSEHFTNKVWRFAVAAHGELYGKQLFATLPLPDGASWLTGADGIEFIGDDAVAVAQYGAGRVFVFDMNGAVIAIHETPDYPLVTNLVMDPASQTLYATASRPKDGNPSGGHEGVLFALPDPLRP